VIYIDYLEKGEKVEQHFLTTHFRDPDGRYIVELPFKHDCQEFGDSLQEAVSRFLAVERRLQRDMELRKQYCKFMNEYLSLGHMRCNELILHATRFVRLAQYIVCSSHQIYINVTAQ